MDEKLAIVGGEPVFDLNRLSIYDPIGEEEKEAVLRVMESGNLSGYLASWGDGFLGGPEVRQFEEEWSHVFNVRHSVSVNSATSGLIAAMGAVGVCPGDEIILPAITMSATAAAPLFYGGIPRFVDIEKDYFCIDPDLVRKSINDKTKAIIAVNIFGQPASLHELRKIADENGIFLIEDNAQAPLATENGIETGTIGHIGVFSLNYHKHIHCGEGGVCTTNDDDLALRLQLIRNHAEACVEEAPVNNLSNMVGFNFRMTELSAAIGREQLKKAKIIIQDRVNFAEKINIGLAGKRGIDLPAIREDCNHAFYMWQGSYKYDIMGIDRDLFADALIKEGFPNFTGYIAPLYWLPMFQQQMALGEKGFPFNLSDTISYQKGLCPVAENFHLKESIGFDICGIRATDEQVDKMIEAFHKVYSNIDQLRSIRSWDQNDR
jgi:perosamine synthetase